MTKHFCDICHKELTYDNRIDVGRWLGAGSYMYCIQCFQNKKNWVKIHANFKVKSKTIASKQKK